MKRIIVVVLLLSSLNGFSQAKAKKKERKGEFYFSWGYNKEWYTRSNIRIMQPSLGNDYRFIGVKGRDRPGWDEQLFSKGLTIPQYNYRIGYIFDRKRGLGLEINFDHTKFIFEDQQVRIDGIMNHVPVNKQIDFNEPNGFYYYLNNGANFFMLNLVKRWKYYESKNGNLRFDGLGKVGFGPVVPHVENSFFGKPNNPGFQIGGWCTGVEYALRGTFFKNVYLEFANKAVYASYTGLKIYEGRARHAFGCYELILSLGGTFPMGKRIK